MLTEEQIKAIALDVGERTYGKDFRSYTDPVIFERIVEDARYVTEKAIALTKPFAEQDRRSFIAVGKYIGVSFTSETDVVSEVYKKLEEIMSVFREHSQEIAIAQNIKHLTNLLERYVEQQAAPIYSGSVGEEAGRSVHTGDCGKADSSD